MAVEKVEEEVKAHVPLRSPYALLYELEGVAVHMRKAEYEALENALSAQKIKLTPILYGKHCLNVPPSQYLPKLFEEVGANKAVSKELMAEIENGMALFLAEAEAVMHPAVGGLIKVAADRHMDIAAMTALKENVARGVLGRWGGLHERTKVGAFESAAKPFPRADTWLKLAKMLNRTARQCIVVCGSQYSAKTALSAGMRCIAVPDEFTAFQDYSGVDAVLDRDDADDVEALLECVAPVRPFI